MNTFVFCGEFQIINISQRVFGQFSFFFLSVHRYLPYIVMRKKKFPEKSRCKNCPFFEPRQSWRYLQIGDIWVFLGYLNSAQRKGLAAHEWVDAAFSSDPTRCLRLMFGPVPMLLLGTPPHHQGVPVVKNLPANVQSLGWEDRLEEDMATHSSILAWNIPWIEEPGGLQFLGLQRVGHN